MARIAERIFSLSSAGADREHTRKSLGMADGSRTNSTACSTAASSVPAAPSEKRVRVPSHTAARSASPRATARTK